MSSSPVLTTATVVLRKRKQRDADNFVLRLASSPSPSHDAQTDSEFELGSSTGPRLSPASRPASKSRPYLCTYAGCAKAYSKPSRLAEHTRSHTGDRPFVCNTCNKSYLRESHLQAHSRSHLDKSERPLVCDEPDCGKRFWTPQHLRVHSELHKGENPFKCTENTCQAAFLKHHQLREHICLVHAPAGTKPYRCSHPGCDKSFAMNQHLKMHSRTHGDKRYTCVNPKCIATQNTNPIYYPTWTTLQHHVRTAHPPTCPHPSCGGKTFTAQKGLRAHLKLHEQREVEEDLNHAGFDLEDKDDEPPLKKRRGGEVGRDWVCDIEGCSKDFKSKKALTSHHKVHHLGRRDFACPHETCKRAFGYKHLLQRHLAKLHGPVSEPDTDDADQDDDRMPAESAAHRLTIDDITGKTYKTRASAQISLAQKLQCPHPVLHDLMAGQATDVSGSRRCEFVFSRAYDLRRHLRSEHRLEIEKDVIARWMQEVKTRVIACV